MPIAESLVAITTSEMPAMLALPAKERPETTETVGTQPESAAMPSQVPQRPLRALAPPVSEPPPRSLARAPPPSANVTSGQPRS